MGIRELKAKLSVLDHNCIQCCGNANGQSIKCRNCLTEKAKRQVLAKLVLRSV